MSPTLQLLNRDPLTLEEALEEESNVINLASYPAAAVQLYRDIWEERRAIEHLVRHHLGLSEQDRCVVQRPAEWLRGAFNVCILVEVFSGNSKSNSKSNSTSHKVMFRCPMPFKLAEARYQGSVDEKVGGEVGAYVWVEEHCPEIRTPHLYGFGFMDGRHFTHARHMPFLSRICRQVWRSLYRLLRLPLLSPYIPNPTSQRVRSGYMLLEYLGPDVGQTLGQTFYSERQDETKRKRLFRGISQIMLSLARIPQPQIGSFRFNHDGTVTLNNRPLSCSMMILENYGASRTMERDTTFNCTDAFASEMITFHDHSFLDQPNAALDEVDCRSQMATRTLLRVMAHRFIKRELRNGPFLLQLTDFHASNIMVDQDWNVTGLIDLEWICALPRELLDVPYWLTGCAIDMIRDDELPRFDKVRREFMQVFEELEAAQCQHASHGMSLGQIMHEMWDSKGVWFWHCLMSVNALYHLVDQKLVPPDAFTLGAAEMISRFWSESDSEEVVRKKLADKQVYDEELRKLFRAESE